MEWPDWNLALPLEIARFVNDREAFRLGLRPRSASDLREDPGAIAKAIYDDLRTRKIHYSSTVFGREGTQAIQTPAAVLANGSGNCVDLTVLFASACLAAEIAPLVAIVTKPDRGRHALILVAPNVDVRSRRSTDLGPVGARQGLVVREGASEVAALLTIAYAQPWIAIETTGVCETTMWGDGRTTTAAQSHDFEESSRVAHEILAGATRIELVDVHHAQRVVRLEPWTPPELDVALRRLRRRWIAAAVCAVTACVVAASIVVWKPWGPDTVDPMPGEFNIAVGDLATSDQSVEHDATAVARTLADLLTTRYQDDGRYLVWGPDEVGVVETDDADRRAADLRADLLIYGELAVNETIGQVYGVDVHVHSAQHARRAPWPIALDERVALRVPIASVVDGTTQSERSITSLALTLDAVAALLADNLDLAEERLQEAERVLEPSDAWALIPALRAWVLLVEAGFTGDSALVTQARQQADRALLLDPTSELAQIVSVSADYMAVIPVRSGVSVDCQAPPPGARPDPADIATLHDRVSRLIATATPVGVIQATSLLGRLSVAESLELYATTGEIDLTGAQALFEDVLDRAGSAPALRVWASDAHRWLALIAMTSLDTPVSDAIEHFMAAVRIDSPIWAGRDLAAAGRAHRCRADGSDVEAVCYFRLAAELAVDDDAALFDRAADEIGAPCPPDWEPQS